MNLASFDGGIFIHKEVSAREYKRRVKVWRDIAIACTISAAITGLICGTFLLIIL